MRAHKASMQMQKQLLKASQWTWQEVLLWALVFATPWIFPGHALIVNEVAIVALFALSLDLVLGYAGVVSLGHAAFLGFGAYTAALFAKHIMPDPFAGLLVGMSASTLLGAVFTHWLFCLFCSLLCVIGFTRHWVPPSKPFATIVCERPPLASTSMPRLPWSTP